jgi:hypothetical protein
MVSTAFKNTVTEIIVRTMRDGGFTGDVTVKNVRLRQDGSVSASIDAVYMGGLGRAKYRATVNPGGSVRVKRVGEVKVRAA